MRQAFRLSSTEVARYKKTSEVSKDFGSLLHWQSIDCLVRNGSSTTSRDPVQRRPSQLKLTANRRSQRMDSGSDSLAPSIRCRFRLISTEMNGRLSANWGSCLGPCPKANARVRAVSELMFWQSQPYGQSTLHGRLAVLGRAKLMPSRSRQPARPLARGSAGASPQCCEQV